MSVKMKVKKGDLVQILSGKDRGKQGRVLEARPGERRVIVENLNLAKRHTRPRPIKDSSRMGGTQVVPGGIIDKPAPISVSNVMVVCPVCGNPTRVGVVETRRQGRDDPRSRLQARGLRPGDRQVSTMVAPTPETYVPRLKQRYDEEIRDRLKEELGLDSVMQTPRVTKITLNMGVGEAKTDAKALDAAIDELTLIAGQRAQVRRAKKSIASFKLREGMPVGAKVTLRGARMYEFLDRLATIALPRIRDFRGLDPGGLRRARELLHRYPRADHLPRDRLRPGSGDSGARRRDHDLGEVGRPRARASRRPRPAVRRREKGFVSGQEVARRQAEADAQAQGSGLLALQSLRPPACGVPEVRGLPDLPARARASGRDPRDDEVELVGGHVLTDPIADMLTRIRNANRALHESASMPTSQIKEEIARILKDEGYIKDFRVIETTDKKDKPLPYRTLVIELKFAKDRRRVITDLKRVSKPGRRVYARKDRLPRVLGGLGTAIMSTSSGIITSRQAAERGVGGEVIAFVW